MKIDFTSNRRPISLTFAFLVGCAGLTSCSNAGPAETDAKVNIVASTQIWADVVDSITDDERVEITAIVTGNDADPHSFEPSAMDMARAEKADLIIAGGGGYDSWLYQSVDQDKVIHALELTEGHNHAHEAEDPHAEHDHAGHDHAGGAAGAEENEHVWYNPGALSQVATDTADAIRKIDPQIQVDAARAEQTIAALDQRIHALPQARIAQTHPIADHIIAHSHMKDVTPAGYRATTLSESEPTAADLNELLQLIDAGEVELLIDSPQTQTPYSTRIREAAEAKHIPIIDVAETPATGINFFDFFDRTLQSFESAASNIGHDH
ncbi:zinc ABC transporter substrate-binding protein [Corynebacterium sp. H128]|uniref:metal ABC transporter solute-binding protein, Zn/Mn family n=1 Tax=unclassified Corynebacterium TaxID=2624378 RepID=UPI0030AA23AA